MHKIIPKKILLYALLLIGFASKTGASGVMASVNAPEKTDTYSTELDLTSLKWNSLLNLRELLLDLTIMIKDQKFMVRAKTPQNSPETVYEFSGTDLAEIVSDASLPGLDQSRFTLKNCTVDSVNKSITLNLENSANPKKLSYTIRLIPIPTAGSSLKEALAAFGPRNIGDSTKKLFTFGEICAYFDPIYFSFILKPVQGGQDYTLIKKTDENKTKAGLFEIDRQFFSQIGEWNTYQVQSLELKNRSIGSTAIRSGLDNSDTSQTHNLNTKLRDFQDSPCLNVYHYLKSIANNPDLITVKQDSVNDHLLPMTDGADLHLVLKGPEFVVKKRSSLTDADYKQLEKAGQIYTLSKHSLDGNAYFIENNPEYRVKTVEIQQQHDGSACIQIVLEGIELQLAFDLDNRASRPKPSP